MWKGLTGAPIHRGSWGGLPDLGITEWLQGTKSTTPTPPPPSPTRNFTPDPNRFILDASGNPIGSRAPVTNPTPRGTITGGAPSGQPQTNLGGQPTSTQSAIDTAQKSQEDAARQAAEASRQAAKRKYEAQVGIAGQAKVQAKGTYDWLIDTLGSNKKDVLEKLATEETTGVESYQQQEEKTRGDYDNAKQQILGTYRDLQREQEKILRGAGLGQSSRSIEAQMKLNNLMGKDLGGISTNEADSLALIGNAVEALKNRSRQGRESVEREAQGKLDKSALDYKAQIDAIDANTQLSANEREDSYAQADTQLGTDIANIRSWAAGMKLQADQTTAKLKDLLDGFIGDMSSTNALLNADLGTKKQATNSVLTQMGLTPLDVEKSPIPSIGQQRKITKTYSSREELDSAYARGEIQPLEYARQLDALQKGGASAALAFANPTGQPETALRPTGFPSARSEDELTRAVFA